MPIYCATCTKNVTQERFPGIKCGSCDKVFHIKCLGLSAELINNINSGSATWLCVTCRGTSSRRSVIDYSVVSVPDIPENPTLRDVMASLSNVQQKLNSLERSQQFISTNVDELNSKVDALTYENRNLKSKLKFMEKQVDGFEKKISFLEEKMDIPNQIQNSRNIIVGGLPSNAIISHEIFVEFVHKIGETISKDDIISIKKMKINNDVKSLLNSSFIVSLNTLELKQRIFNTFRTSKQSIFWDEIDETMGKTRIRLLHHLTKHQGQLYTEAKKFKIKNNYRFLWCANNKILLRKQPGSDVYHIRSLDVLNQLQQRIERANNTLDETRSSLEIAQEDTID